MQDFLVIDVETTGLDSFRDKLHGLGVAFEEDVTAYYRADEIPDEVVEMLANPKIPKVGQNVRFDARFLENNGFEVNGTLVDIACMAQLIDENQSVGLKHRVEITLGKEYLSGFRDLDRAYDEAGVKTLQALVAADLVSGRWTDVIATYCEEDCNNTLKLLHVYSEKLNATKTEVVDLMRYYQEEVMPLDEILLDMELRGIRVDEVKLARVKKNLEEEIENHLTELDILAREPRAHIEEQLYEAVKATKKTEKGKANVQRCSDKYKTRFNWDSNAHLASLIYDYYEYTPVSYTKSGKRSVNAGDLTAIARDHTTSERLTEILEKLFKYRNTQKLLSTYVEGIKDRMVEGRIYPQYLQAGGGGGGGTVTGRLSSREPNIQNLPKHGGIRELFIPDPGMAFLYADYSQLQLRIAAHLAQDEKMMGAFIEGTDLHQQTATQLGIERSAGKTLNFALIFDAREYRLLEELSKQDPTYTKDDMTRMRKAFFRTYKDYKEYLDAVKAWVQEKGYIYSSFGRVRRLPEIQYGQYLDWNTREITQDMPQDLYDALQGGGFNQARKKYSHALKQAYNFPIQSFEASLVKRAMIALDRAGFQIVTQVHDSLIIQVPIEEIEAASSEMRRIMEAAGKSVKMSVPLVAQVKLLTSFDEHAGEELAA